LFDYSQGTPEEIRALLRPTSIEVTEGRSQIVETILVKGPILDDMKLGGSMHRQNEGQVATGTVVYLFYFFWKKKN
jgi:hypothetical protein